MNGKPIPLSVNCTQSTVKANTGRNTLLRLFSGLGFLYPDTWGINDKINWKTLSANPGDLYREYEIMNTLKAITPKLSRKI